MSVRNNLCGDNQVPDLTSEEQSLLGHRPSTVQNPFASLLSSACRPFRFIRRWQYDHRDYLAELFGTFLFVFLGLAVTAQYKLNVMDDCSNIGPFLIWGLALMIAIYACRHVSAAHLNPAITLAFALFRDFPKRKVIGYWIVQGVGAFMAAAAVYSLFHSDIDRFDDGHRQVDGPQATGDIFYVTPLSNTSHGKQFILEFLGTLLLVVVICSISDQYNSRDIGALLPIVAGLTLTTLLTCLVYERGASFNPARDLGPRLFTLIFYGIGVFTNHNFYFWVPTVAPLLGAASGCIVYDILVPSTPIDQACHTRSLPSNVLSNAEAGQNGGHHYMGTSTGITVDNDASTC